MPMVEVLQGTKFGRLAYVGPAVVEQVRWKRRHAQWVCDCGKVCVKPIGRVKSGMVRSCGCLVADSVRAANTTHGGKYTREYRIWSGMRNRCTNRNLEDYARYGAKGIKVCDRWLKTSLPTWALAHLHLTRLIASTVNGITNPEIVVGLRKSSNEISTTSHLSTPLMG